MKKWLKDTLEPQLADRKIYPIPDECPDQYFIVQKSGVNSEGFTYQIVFNTKPIIDNNSYGIYIFDNENNHIYFQEFKSTQSIPPVWDRQSSYIEYIDFLLLQKFINTICEKNNWPIFPTTDSPDGCGFYKYRFDQKGETLEKDLLKIRGGKEYEILMILASAMPELVEEAKDFVNRTIMH